MDENKLNNLENQAAENAVQKDPFMPENKEKKKRGRPPKNPGEKVKAEQAGPAPKQEQKTHSIPTHQLIRPAMPFVSGIGIAIAGDERAALRADEAEGMAYAIGAVIDKYLPDAMNKYGPEIMLAAVMSQYGLRVYALRKLKQGGHLDEKPAQQPNEARPVDAQVVQ